MGNNKTESGYLKSLSVFLYVQSAFAGGIRNVFPVATTTEDALVDAQSKPPALPSYPIVTHVFPNDNSVTWHEFYMRTLQRPDPAQGKKLFDYAMGKLSDPAEYPSALKYFDHIVDRYAKKSNENDPFKLDIKFRNEVYSLQTSDDSLTYFTDSEFILAAYQVAKDQAKWIEKHGFKNLHQRATHASEKFKNSSRREDILMRYMLNLAMVDSEAIKKISADQVKERRPDDYAYFSSLVNMDSRVVLMCHSVMNELNNAIASAHYEKNEDGIYHVPILADANALMIHVVREAYQDWIVRETKNKKKCTTNCANNDKKPSKPTTIPDNHSDKADYLNILMGIKTFAGAVLMGKGIYEWFTAKKPAPANLARDIVSVKEIPHHRNRKGKQPTIKN